MHNTSSIYCRGVGKTFLIGGGGAQSESTHRVVSNLYNNL